MVRSRSNDQLRQVGNVLYGTTLRGGPANQGVLFRINTDGTGYAVLHTFYGRPATVRCPTAIPLPSARSSIGMTSRGGANRQGTIYAMNDDGTGFQILYSFSQATGTQPRGFVAIQARIALRHDARSAAPPETA